MPGVGVSLKIEIPTPNLGQNPDSGGLRHHTPAAKRCASSQQTHCLHESVLPIAIDTEIQLKTVLYRTLCCILIDERRNATTSMYLRLAARIAFSVIHSPHPRETPRVCY